MQNCLSIRKVLIHVTRLNSSGNNDRKEIEKGNGISDAGKTGSQENELLIKRVFCITSLVAEL